MGHTKVGDKNPYLELRYQPGSRIKKIVVKNRAASANIQSRIVGANIRLCSDNICAKKVLFSGTFKAIQNVYTFVLDCKQGPKPSKPTPPKIPAGTPCATMEPKCHGIPAAQCKKPCDLKGSSSCCTYRPGCHSCCNGGYLNDKCCPPGHGKCPAGLPPLSSFISWQ